MRAKVVSRILLTLLFISMLALTFSIHQATSEPTTWSVDDDGPADFSSIQEAINAASSWDTIYVYNGTYYENVVVNKTVSLIGENKKTTIIDGNGTGKVVHLSSDDVKICNFTIQNSGRDGTDSGIHYWMPISDAYISNNIITNNQYGVRASTGALVQDTAIFVDNTIASNELHGFYLSGVGITLQSNLICFNDHGIHVTAPGDENTIVYIHNNTVCDNENGIWAEFHSVTGGVEGNIIGNNILSNNQSGISLIGYVSLGSIYHNNFVNNTQQAYVEEAYVWNWDNGYPSGGNYWSDYEERYPDAQELDGSGIWDTPYDIDENNQDNYPLVNPWETTAPPPSIPEFPIGLATEILFIPVIIYIFWRSKQRKKLFQIF